MRDSIEINGKKWNVLGKRDGGVFCIADKPYRMNETLDDSNDWRKSSLRKWLNTEIYDEIIAVIGKENIISFKRDLISLDGQIEYGTCEDEVSILSVDEYRYYRRKLPNTISYYWWTLTPWSTKCNNYNTSMAIIVPNGGIDTYNCYGNNAVRPVCIFAEDLFKEEEN